MTLSTQKLSGWFTASDVNHRLPDSLASKTDHPKNTTTTMTHSAQLVATDYTAADPLAVHMASNYHSESQIAAAAFTGAAIEAHTLHRVRRWSNLAGGSMLAIIAVCVGGLTLKNFLTVDLSPNSAYQLTGALMVLSTFALLATSLLGIGRMGILSCKHAEHVRSQAYLQPIAGTDLCQTALQYVKNGPADVARWRDQAIAERGQLYAFDVEIMRGIYQQDQAARSAAEREQVNNAACRELHGVASTAG